MFNYTNMLHILILVFSGQEWCGSFADFLVRSGGMAAEYELIKKCSGTEGTRCKQGRRSKVSMEVSNE